MRKSKVKVSDKGYYGFKLNDYKDNIIYEELKTIMYEIPEIGSKNELFADIPDTNNRYVISNKGNVYEKIYNSHFNRSEYKKIDTVDFCYGGENSSMGNGTIAIYKYAKIYNKRNKLFTLWVGDTVAELFVAKPYMLWFKGLIESKILIDQSKLRVSYKDNVGTNVKYTNLEWVFRNDIAYKGVTIGNNTLPKYDNGGEKYVFYRISDGVVKGITNNIRDGKYYLGKQCVNGDIVIRMCKGRRKSAIDKDGDEVTCRKLSCLKNDTSKIAVTAYNNAIEYLKYIDSKNKLF